LTGLDGFLYSFVTFSKEVGFALESVSEGTWESETEGG
jgi:hypothetical protein